MADVTTTYGSISQRTAAWVALKMLEHAEPIEVLQKYGQTKPVPKNKAESVKFRRPVPFDVSTTPVVEGVTPDSHALTYEDVQADLEEYIGVTAITDRVADLAEDPVLADAAMLSGEQAAETLELVTYNAVKAGSNVFYSNGSATGDVNTAITLNKQRKIVRKLKRNRAKKVRKRIAASPNYATEPVDAAFLAFCHTDCEADIRNMTNFVPVEKYGQMKAEPNEIGKVEDVRYITSPLLEPALAAGSATLNGMVSEGGSKVDVYSIIYTGANAYATIPLKGKEAIKPMVLNPDTPSKADPAAQKGYVSWKVYFAAKILNEDWIACLKTAVTDI